jgi:hypothetical protein
MVETCCTRAVNVALSMLDGGDEVRESCVGEGFLEDAMNGLFVESVKAEGGESLFPECALFSDGVLSLLVKVCGYMGVSGLLL